MGRKEEICNPKFVITALVNVTCLISLPNFGGLLTISLDIYGLSANFQNGNEKNDTHDLQISTTKGKNVGFENVIWSRSFKRVSLLLICQQYNVDNSILGNPSSYHLLAMQRQLREQQLQLQQQQAQHQTLVEHVYQNELNLKQYAASQANEVFNKMQESLRHLQEQYDQQDQMCQLVGHLTSLEDRVRELECAQSNRQDLLTHYQFIADFQQHQLQQLIGEQNGSIRSDKITSGRQSCPSLPDLRQVMPLKNSGACRPPRPKSAEVENQQSLTWNACPPNYVKSDPNTQRPRSADNLRSSRPECFASSRPQARLPSQTQCEYPPDAAAFQRLPSMSRSPVESSFHHAASSSRVVRILPLRHTPAPTFDEFQPQHSTHQPSSRGM